MLDEFPHSVKLVVKPFPPADSQPALLLASAALAAHAQGHFWEFREQLFLQEGHVSAGDLADIAEAVGVDGVRFRRDLVSPEIQQLLARGINDGVHRGVDGTPMVFVNQEPVTSIDALLRAIQDALAE